jgi:Putative DNA-binding domain
MKRSKPTNSSGNLKPSPRKRQTPRELHDLQRLMANAVMRPLNAADRMQSRWSDGRPTRRIIEGFIKPNDRLTSFERLEIYNRQYWFRVLDCFYEDYPGLRTVLGEKKFDRLAKIYLNQFPSASFTLRNLGRRLENFIRKNPSLAKPHFKLALDMARLEWAYIEAFDNEDRPLLTTDDILDQQASQVRLNLQPHLILLQLSHPLDDFLIALRENTGLRTEASNAREDRSHHSRARTRRFPKPETIYLAVHRRNNGVYYKRLEPAQFQLLSALHRGDTLDKALAGFSPRQAATLTAEKIRSWFEDWSALGWFCRTEKSQSS